MLVDSSQLWTVRRDHHRHRCLSREWQGRDYYDGDDASGGVYHSQFFVNHVTKYDLALLHVFPVMIHEKEAYRMITCLFKGKHFNNCIVAVAINKCVGWGFFLNTWFFLRRPNSICSTVRNVKKPIVK